MVIKEYHNPYYKRYSLIENFQLSSLLDELKIEASDLKMEKVQLLRNLMQSGVEEAIVRFLREFDSTQS